MADSQQTVRRCLAADGVSGRRGFAVWFLVVRLGVVMTGLCSGRLDGVCTRRIDGRQGREHACTFLAAPVVSRQTAARVGGGGADSTAREVAARGMHAGSVCRNR